MPVIRGLRLVFFGVLFNGLWSIIKVVSSLGRFFRFTPRAPSDAFAAPSFWQTAGGLLLTFLFLSAGIGDAGYCYYLHQVATARKAAENELSAVADLKVRQILDWRESNLDNAELIAGDDFLARQIEEFVAKPAESPLRLPLLAWLRKIREHTHGLRALLIDRQMNVCLAYPEEKTWFGPTAHTFALEALRSGHTVMSDLHRSHFSGEVHLDLAVPIADGHRAAVVLPPAPRGLPPAPGKPMPIAVIDIEVDPNHFLFPRMQSWPTPSPTAETTLVRQEGDEAVFLCELRHKPGALLSERVPVSRKGVAAVETALGFEGVMEGVDYRDVPVLAATRRVPGTPWSIVAKVDQAEIYAPLRERGLTTAAIGAVCVILAAVIVAFLGRRHDNLWLRRQLTERQRGEDELRQYAAAVESTNVRLEELNEAAESANRSKSQFLANMSHEIRTPMTAIIGYTELLADRALSPSDRDNHLAVVRRNAEHLLDLINDILDISKIEAGKLSIEQRRCNLPALACDVASLLRPRAIQRGLSLELRYQSAIPEEIITDGPRVRQALVNLVGNAIKFTHQGGVTIGLGFVPAAADRAAAVKFEVIDTGIGIAEEVLPNLFQPFAQADASTSRQYGGSGLGLSISRHLVELLGGQLSVESAAGKGSTFTIALPAGDLSATRMLSGPAESIVIGKERRDAVSTSLAGVSVLLAEDGPDNQRLIQLLLRKAGAAVEIADNGRLAVEKAMSRTFDIILMDVQMPEMDGHRATRLLRERGFSKPILALTAHAMEADHQRCLEAGCDDHLTKPIDRARLIETIARHVKRDEDLTGAPASAKTGHPLVHNPTFGGTPWVTACDDAATECGLRSEFAGDAEMAEILEEFVTGLSQYVSDMREALAARQHQALQQLAHQLKGAGGSYGYPQLTDAAALLEDAARGLEGAPDSATRRVPPEQALGGLIAVCRRIQIGRGHPLAGHTTLKEAVQS